MARMNCICGEVLSNSAAPNKIHLRVYTDEEWDEILNCESIVPWMFPLPKREVWRCPSCKRIYVFKEGNDRPEMIYKLEKYQ